MDIMDLERIQRHATKYILNDFHSSYKNRLQSLKILPLMTQLELYDILFFFRCLKEPNENNAFSIQSYVSFSNSNTRSTTHLKLKHLSKTHAAGHFYFNRLPRLWNSLPPLNLNLSFHTIKSNCFGLISSIHSRVISHVHSISSVLALDVCHVLFLLIIPCSYLMLFVLCNALSVPRTPAPLTGVPSVHSVTYSYFIAIFSFVLCTVKS